MHFGNPTFVFLPFAKPLTLLSVTSNILDNEIADRVTTTTVFNNAILLLTLSSFLQMINEKVHDSPQPFEQIFQL